MTNLIQQTQTTPIIAYTCFNENWESEKHQYEVGKTYEHTDEVKFGESGFHACEYPLDVLLYWTPANSKFAVVEMQGEIHKGDGRGAKIATNKIHIQTELTISELADQAVEWVKNKVNWDRVTSNDEQKSVAANTRNRSAVTNKGNLSVACNTGKWSAATNIGGWSLAANTSDQSLATNAGIQSIAANTGDQSVVTNTGEWSAAINTGDQSAATNSGKQSASTNTGDLSVAINMGDWSASTNTGHQSLATNTGNRSVATSVGYMSAASAEGSHSVAISVGYCSKAKASASGAIVCVYRDSNDDLIHIRASKVGENGIKPDTFYTLNEQGEFVEAQD